MFKLHYSEQNIDHVSLTEKELDPLILRSKTTPEEIL
jgi:hypothetical protein